MGKYVLRTDGLGLPMWFAGSLPEGHTGAVIALAEFIHDAYTFPGESEANQAAATLGDYFVVADFDKEVLSFYRREKFPKGGA